MKTILSVINPANLPGRGGAERVGSAIPAVMLTAVLAVFLLSGCQTLLPYAGEERVERTAGEPLFGFGRRAEERQVGDLLAFYEHLGEHAPAELDEEIEALRERVSEESDTVCTEARLQLGVAALVHRGGVDPGLMAPCLEEDTPTAVLRFARLVHLELMQLEQHTVSVTALERRVRAQHQEIAELKRQLEGLKAIERSLQRRDP